MTLLGKILAFLNLIVGLGIVSWSVSVATSRPYWFEPVPEAVEKGNSPESFAQLKQEMESAGRAATVASRSWGAAYKQLEAAEQRRATRLKGYETRLAWAKTGNKDKGGAGFFQSVLEKDAAGNDTALLDLNTVGPAIIGVDSLPLKGADTLLATYAADVKQAEALVGQIVTVRKQIEAIGKTIKAEQDRLFAMTGIREAVQNELFYIAPFELNTYANRGTILRRKGQLEARLTDLNKAPK